MATQDPPCTEICGEEIERFRKAFEADPRYRIAMNAVTKTTVKSVAMNRQAVVRNNHTFSHMVKAGAATSQNASGRCWMFAGLNLFRMAAAENMSMEDFELSQNYQFFWDKLERSNYFLESILQTLDEDKDGRLIAWLMANPIQDGGQWDMFVNLVEKYGVVPKEVMPETESSSASGMMNDRITLKLREYGARLRQAHQKGASAESLRARKAEMLAEVYRMLCIHLGEPPKEFLWQWRDKDKKFHRDGVLTPQEFFAKHVPVDLDSMVCLIHCPTEATPFNTLYTISYLGNVVGGRITRYLNVDLDVMKRAAVEQIKAEKPVWFGCDVGKMFDRDLGLMDVELFNYQDIYGTPFTLNKAERLDYGVSAMNHAMVFTGVDLDDQDRPRKWRVENSWGDKNGDKGFMVMTDKWFDEYNYEVVVDKKHLSSDILKILDTKPVALPPWHPMGALADAR
ncbi:MAG TPA: C1 family peptidase [Chthonomonadaceae bacterium]|nr:C1 family peptidase [Chthonomonadaceae bacterium]